MRVISPGIRFYPSYCAYWALSRQSMMTFAYVKMIPIPSSVTAYGFSGDIRIVVPLDRCDPLRHSCPDIIIGER